MGPSFDAVWRQPYHWTLVQYLGLMDRERIHALEREAESIQSARRFNEALLRPQALEHARMALLAKLRSGAGDAGDRPSAEQLADEMRMLGARLKKTQSVS